MLTIRSKWFRNLLEADGEGLTSSRIEKAFLNGTSAFISTSRDKS